MQTDPNKPIRKPISTEEFNKEVRRWTYRTRENAVNRLKSRTAGSSGEGANSVHPSIKKEFGEVYTTGFKFKYHLVFVHYGVGRGYIRKGGMVVRGHRDDNDKFKRYRGKPAKTWKENYSSDTRPIERSPYDWLDSEIRKRVDKLADIAAAYHGDKAAQEVIKNSGNFLIEKK